MVDKINDIDLLRVLGGGRAAGETPGDEAADPLSDLGKMIREAAKAKHSQWHRGMVHRMHAATKQALDKVQADNAALGRLDDYAMMHGTMAMRQQIKKMISHLNPPTEIIESADYQELMELIWPSATKREKNAFKKGSAVRGKVKTELMQQQVRDAIKQASRRAGQKSMSQLNTDSSDLSGFSQMAFEQMARALKRAMKKRKAKFTEDGELIIDPEAGLSEAEELKAVRELQSMMQIFSQRALETMRTVREEIAPKWAPEQQPWLLQEADKQVYDILLATIPKELFEETAAYQDIQDLRRGQEVFTLRAADKLTEAARRGE